MAGMRKEAVLAMRDNEFGRFADDLRRRGFSDKKESRPENGVICYDAIPVARLCKAVAGFEIFVDGVEAGIADFDPLHPQGSCRIVGVKARFETPATTGMGLIMKAYEGKSHAVQAGRYSAEIVPSNDAGAIIRNGLMLEEIIGRLRDDPAMADALDAKEISGVMSEALGKIKSTNPHKDYVEGYMESLLSWCAERYDARLRRLRTDPAIVAAMGMVADR